MNDPAAAQHGGHRLAARIRQFGIRARNSWFLLLLGLVAGSVIFSSSALKAITDILEVVIPKPDALSVAREGTRDQISRDFIEATSRRLYWSRNFLGRIGRRAPSAEIHESWRELLKAIEYMTSRALVYANLFEEFYGKSRRAEYEYGIQTDFNAITDQVVDLRYSRAVKMLEFPDGATAGLAEAEATELKVRIDKLTHSMDDLYIRIYLFTSCFDKKQRTSPTCA